MSCAYSDIAPPRVVGQGEDLEIARPRRLIFLGDSKNSLGGRRKRRRGGLAVKVVLKSP